MNAAPMDLNETSSGAAEAYSRMIKELKSHGELDLAAEACERALTKFPKNSNLHIIKAQIQITASQKERSVELLKDALKSLEEALKLDPHNYLGRILASQILIKGKAYKKAKSLLSGILKISPDDEKASGLMALIEKAKKKKGKPAEPAAERPAAEKVPEPAEPAEPPDMSPPSPEAAPTVAMQSDEGQIIVKSTAHEPGPEEQAITEQMLETEPGSNQWVIDDKMIIDSGDADTARHHDMLISKLTMFSRLEGLSALFLVDANGQPFKTINRAGVDENVIPSLVFNVYRASVTGVRRTGFGSFQRGTLVASSWTIILANAFYATLAIVVDNDANLSAVEARLQRYLEEIAG